MTLLRVPVILLLVFLIFAESLADTRYFVKLNQDDNNNKAEQKFPENSSERSRAIYRINNNDESMILETLKANHDKRNSFVETSTFDPDVLNKFLDEFANKIKSTTDKNYGYPYGDVKSSSVTSLEVDNGGSTDISTSTEETIIEHGSSSPVDDLKVLNDTVKRNKFYNSNTDDRNGWVTLEAVPWSKSKISKWQANPSSHRPWPETTKWDKPNGAKPWQSDYPTRPNYENNKPWYDKPKPHWPDYDQDRPKPMPTPTRPSYFSDRYDTSPSQAQKWPPERPNSSWEDFPESHRPTSDIITDNRPSNFPTNNWNRYDQVSKPSYSSFNDRYGNQQDEMNNDWPSNNYPNKFEHMNSNNNNNNKASFSRPTNRPFYSNYEYESHHPPSHPSSGDGQWVLLSTNRGYQKSRQRSLKLDVPNDEPLKSFNTPNERVLGKGEDSDPAIPVMTSKRQVRLTVLPSINGTNTTTSHGGLLEVEKTFKTVDQSQREYEASQKLSQAPTLLNKRPIRNTVVNNRPSNSAVLAAVGAGMLPATMAMMIPLMLGRKKRSIDITQDYKNLTTYNYHPRELNAQAF